MSWNWLVTKVVSLSSLPLKLPASSSSLLRVSFCSRWEQVQQSYAVTLISQRSQSPVEYRHTASSFLFLSMLFEKYVSLLGKVISQWKHSCSTAGPPTQREQRTKLSELGLKASFFALLVMICFCKSIRRLAEYWSCFLWILHPLHGMLVTISWLCRRLNDLATYVGGSLTLPCFASSFFDAIVAGFRSGIGKGVYCAATDKAPVQASG